MCKPVNWWEVSFWSWHHYWRPELRTSNWLVSACPVFVNR
jgi:hypothetical protein